MDIGLKCFQNETGDASILIECPEYIVTSRWCQLPYNELNTFLKKKKRTSACLELVFYNKAKLNQISPNIKTILENAKEAEGRHFPIIIFRY